MSKSHILDTIRYVLGHGSISGISGGIGHQQAVVTSLAKQHGKTGNMEKQEMKFKEGDKVKMAATWSRSDFAINNLTPGKIYTVGPSSRYVHRDALVLKETGGTVQQMGRDKKCRDKRRHSLHLAR